MSADPNAVVVIGAGIVGVCSAIYLQRAGLAVTLVDRQGCGEACSFGNAGNMTNAACVPAALPGIVRQIPQMLRDADGPLKVRIRDLPRLWPFFRRFASASRTEAVEAIADARHSLMAKLDEAYAPLIKEAGAEDLVRRSGLMFVFEQEGSLAGARYGIDLRRHRGVPVDILSGDEAREMEPALTPAVKAAFYLPTVAHTVDPWQLTQKLAELFTRNGGVILQDEVLDFELDDARQLHSVIMRGGRQPFRRALVAAGVWSRRLASKLGYRLPLVAERGYHVMLRNPGLSLRVSLASGDRNIAITEMQQGIRASGIAEYASLDAPPNFAHADLVHRHARKILPALGPMVQSRWMGHRPALPDSKPVIGRSPRHPSIFLAFGHYHNGLGLAAITGKLIAELMTGQTPSVDLSPFRPDRF